MTPGPDPLPPLHEFRHGPFRARQIWWLEGEHLYWQKGRSTGSLALKDIAALRLHFRPGGPDGLASCALVERSGRRHRITDRYWFRWTAAERRRFGRRERREASFQALTSDLVRRLAVINPQARLLIGPTRGEWVVSAVMACLALALILGGAGLMIARGQVSLPALAFLGMSAFILPLLWPVLRAGGPAPLNPETLMPPSGAS